MEENTMLQILEQVKINIGLLNEHQKTDSRLQRLIEKARIQIIAEGAIFNPENIAHQEVLVDYASWLWNTRHESNNEMPTFLRKEINNLIFGEEAENE